jgi:hypothetical protein
MIMRKHKHIKQLKSRRLFRCEGQIDSPLPTADG